MSRKLVKKAFSRVKPIKINNRLFAGNKVINNMQSLFTTYYDYSYKKNISLILSKALHSEKAIGYKFTVYNKKFTSFFWPKTPAYFFLRKGRILLIDWTSFDNYCSALSSLKGEADISKMPVIAASISGHFINYNKFSLAEIREFVTASINHNLAHLMQVFLSVLHNNLWLLYHAIINVNTSLALYEILKKNK